MEQTPSNMPVMESKPGMAGWFSVWMKAITKPNEQTFIDITESPEAKLQTALIWIFIAGLVSGIAQAILQVISAAIGTTPQLPIPGLEQYTPNGGANGGLGISLIFLCLTPILSTIFFAIGTALIQWIAKLFGGVGTFEKLAYALAAITVPFTLVSALLTLGSAIPFVGFCFGIISIGLLLYIIVLQVMAVKGVNRLGWWQAIGSVLIVPGTLFLCSCLMIAILMLMGPAVGDVFSQINQSLAP